MGLRFRKSISLGSFLRLNLSKSGVSVGVGPRGFNVNVGPRGLRRTVGLPGTGLYYQDTSSWPKSEEAALPPNVETESNLSGIWILIGIVVVIVVVAVISGSGSKESASKTTAVNVSKAEAPPIRPAVTALKPDRPLNQDEVRELQLLLNGQGFNAGTPDGIIGPKTQTAAQAYIRAHRVTAQGASSLRLLETARSSRK